MNFKKLALTAGAVGALGIAGSFGTSAAFNADETKELAFSAGTVKIVNEFNLPWQNLGTGVREGANAGHIKVKNDGTEPINVFLDFDGVVDVVDWQTPGTSNRHSTNPLAENLNIDSSFSSDFAQMGDNATRLWVLNRRGLSAVPNATGTGPLVLDSGQEKTIYFRAWIRERSATNPIPGDGGDDNLMQGLVSNQKITVKAIEAGADDIPLTSPYDNGL
jgi:predicted ribosomally synthesized peptide with SipW-like signal peptide